MYSHIKSEEELKIRVGDDWFSKFDCATKLGNLDFCVSYKDGDLLGLESVLWAEAKKGECDIYKMFAQLILTLGKQRIYDNHILPKWLAVFDAKKIVFAQYADFSHLFSLTGSFDWTVTPSNPNTKEFIHIKNLVDNLLKEHQYLYEYKNHQAELRAFIHQNLTQNSNERVTQIDNNNVRGIYLRWVREVMPLISTNFDELYSKYKILDCEFFLADIFVDDEQNQSISADLLVIFNNDGYEIASKKVNAILDLTAKIKDINKYHTFWRRYKRPPHKDWQEWILLRRDLFLPQDILERKGAFFTPLPWVELSQEYLAHVLGQTWQDEYYVWDCACGTGNLLAGLTNPRNIFASTLDQADVNHIHESISKVETISGKNKAYLLKSHVFQFDFLNDNFFDVLENRFDPKTGKQVASELVKSKLPLKLQEILQDDAKRQKLLIYINPPYAEVGNKKTIIGDENLHKPGVSNENLTHTKYQQKIGAARRELFALFLIRIFKELPQCTIANFSKLKSLQSLNFKKFRKIFTPKLLSLHLMPADTFDNVNGAFPIGFFIWDLKQSAHFKKIKAKIYQPVNYPNHKNKQHFAVKLHPTKTKTIVNRDGNKYISNWIAEKNLYLLEGLDFYVSFNEILGYMNSHSNDFQQQRLVFVENIELMHNNGHRHTLICAINLIAVAIYLAVRHCININWLNDRDQFLYPKKSWLKDTPFHNDCLAFTLFHGQNRITAHKGINHFIPFDWIKAGADRAFQSSFMYDFLQGTLILVLTNKSKQQLLKRKKL